MFGARQAGVALQKHGGRPLRPLQDVDVLGKIGDFKVRQAVLPLAEKVAGPAQAQILFGDLKTVGLTAQRV